MRVKMLLVPVVASVALLAACTPSEPTSNTTPTATSNGVEALEADAILDESELALKSAGSFTLSTDSFAAGFVTLEDLQFVYDGDDLVGTGTVAGVGFEVRKIGDDLYLNANAELYGPALEVFAPDLDTSVLSAISDKWVKVPAAALPLVVPIPLSVDDIFAAVATPVTKGEPATVDGTPVITVTDADGSVLKVATTGEPYLLEIALEDSTITFSGFGDPADPVEEPEDAIDLLAMFSS